MTWVRAQRKSYLRNMKSYSLIGIYILGREQGKGKKKKKIKVKNQALKHLIEEIKRKLANRVVIQ